MAKPDVYNAVLENDKGQIRMEIAAEDSDEARFIAETRARAEGDSNAYKVKSVQKA
jgi:hypothetical protein